MNTYFAPAEKASDKELATEIDSVTKNPVISGLLHSVYGLLAVLNEQRQIIAINDSFLEELGIDNPEEVLGLRHGEVLKCIHAEKEPAGCGTTEFCSSCGAAIAIVSSLEKDEPVERVCAITSDKGDKEEDVAFLVKSNPICIDNKKFLLIFLQDITKEQQRAALERTFFHDINNMLGVLLGSSELLLEVSPSDLAVNIHQASLRLINEIDIQRCLTNRDDNVYLPEKDDYTSEEILTELKSTFKNHPEAVGKIIEYPENPPMVTINTDLSLVLRVLSNMMLNALEATGASNTVKVWVEKDEAGISFCVWNQEEIPEIISKRVFQRNFTTKQDSGRGIGTFSMKLFGEQVLGGKVSFTSSREKGTVFQFRCPL